MRKRAKRPRNIALDQVLPRTARERKKLAKRFRGLFVRAGTAGLYADGRARSRVFVRTIYPQVPEPVYETILDDSEATVGQSIRKLTDPIARYTGKQR